MESVSAAARAREACLAAVTRLRDADAPLQGLAEFIPARRRFGIRRPATMRPITRVWQLGSLLLASPRDGDAAASGDSPLLFAAGRITRAAERGRPGYQSLSLEERRDIAAAALRGGYAAGEPVHFDARAISFTEDSAEDPAALIGFADGEFRVRWRPGAPLTGSPTVNAFLTERIALLLDPLG